MNNFLNAQTQSQEQTATDLQQATSTNSGSSVISSILKVALIGGLGAIFFFLKPKKTESETVEKIDESENAPVKKGQTYIDPKTGEELITIKKGGRKKKVNTEQKTPKT